MAGKTIRLFLVDGVSSGLMTLEVMNWTGKVLVLPRSQLAKAGSRSEARRTGVYMLVGPDPDAASRSMVYVGESDDVYQRLLQHDGDEDKDFATRLVLLVSKDENLTKAHGRYLEHRIIELTKASGRAKLVNGQAGSPVNLPESDRADMDGFLEQMQLVLPVLGFDFTQPKIDASSIADSPESESVSPTFVLSEVGVMAKAREIDDEFVVLKGSTARKQGVNSWIAYKALRDQLVQEGKLVEETGDPDRYLVVDDIPFSSPSAAATVLLARTTNGRTHWKVENSEATYQDWYTRRLNEAPSASPTIGVPEQAIG
jgi:hypothetical protein